MGNEIFEMAVEFGVIDKAGAWFSYNGEKIGQGAVKAKAWLNEHGDIKQAITAKVKEVMMKPNKEKMISKNENLEFNPETGEIR